MDKWLGRLALVTGASAGIGTDICRRLVGHGVRVIGCARRTERLKLLEKELNSNSCLFTPFTCDVGKSDEVAAMFDYVAKHHGGVDICINNAGFSKSKTLLDGNIDVWRDMMNVNVVALTQCSQLSINSMKQRNITDGYVINIGSMSGHRLVSTPSTFYAATKHAVRVLTEGLRRELRQLKSPIRVSQISSGMVDTEFSMMSNNFTEQENKEFIDSVPTLSSNDMADAIIYLLSLPSHVEVHDILVRPTEQVA